MAQFFLPTLTLLPIIFFICIIDAPTTSDAWGPLGHGIICSIAESRLNKHVKREVKSLLAGKNLKDVCTWADDVRDIPAYSWSKPLHYANIQDDKATAFDYDRDCRNRRCVVGAIINDILDLQSNYNKKPTPDKLDETLKFLAHFMGDVHQPLHVGFQSDRGGKTLIVSVDPRSTVRTDLHEVWDTTIIARALREKYGNNFEKMVRDIDGTTVPGLTEEDNTSLYGGYATESFTDARNYAYKNMKGRDLRSMHKIIELTERYLDDRYDRVVKKRLAQAGRRLAELLNSIFVPPPTPSSLQTEIVSVY